MKRLIVKFAPFLLAFLLGACATVLWDNRHQIHEVWANLSQYYQD